MQQTPESRKIVVICPVKNESWILSTFLTAVSTFADHVIIGDHFSTDNSREIASQFPKVHLLETKNKEFSEATRRNELLTAARMFGESNLIISLDADEVLTPNFIKPENLEAMKSKSPGTRFAIPHLNVLPGWKQYWKVPMAPIAFIDDGDLHDTRLKIHFPRIPNNKQGPVEKLSRCGIIHLQYVDWLRMESKHQWYRVWERINFPRKSQLAIYRRYSHMYFVPRWRLKTVPPQWHEAYAEIGIKLATLGTHPADYWWDDEVSRLVEANANLDFSLLQYTANPGTSNTPSTREQEFARYLRQTEWLARTSWLLPVRLILRSVDAINSKRFA